MRAESEQRRLSLGPIRLRFVLPLLAALLTLGILAACSGRGNEPGAAPPPAGGSSVSSTSPAAPAGGEEGAAEAGAASAGNGARGGAGADGTAAGGAGSGAAAGTESGAAQPAAEAKPIKIGFAMDTLLEERWKKDRDLFREAAEALGAEVVIKSASGDDARQIAQAEAMISAGVDVLVIVPHNAEATAALVKKAHDAGIKVLSYDRLVRNADVDLYVSFDNVQVGRLQARAIVKLVPKGNYVYIGGADTDNNAHQFKQGVFEVLQPMIDRGEIRVVYDQWSKDWKPVHALDNMREALNANGSGGIDAVIGANDATAGGAVQALEEHGLSGRVPVAGQDADLAAIRRIARGEQTMTVYKPIGRLAAETAKLAVELARGEIPETNRRVNNGKIEVPSVLLAPIAVDASNLEETVIADGYHSREDVYAASGE
ncbi:D-xylose ABC transporter substrate-binding protein [Saccharibacillus sp. CPCC 101409]|uniref:D-xylose ABC transporter substrate-binding protein n=1 Tax=Saccharibacillus sp. CPCC 101409 TaxID=3058041 RepID=UPI002670F60F|nr:D-xylose ABC transporter substrate-binding protein [Saccharibacillus sp. CPCC 101409]MDO3408357.1 D-xylose ABC transporter substrate-binding protein [Saccharibacillus sp. CPCC 101409]